MDGVFTKLTILEDRLAPYRKLRGGAIAELGATVLFHAQYGSRNFPKLWERHVVGEEVLNRCPLLGRIWWTIDVDSIVPRMPRKKLWSLARVPTREVLGQRVGSNVMYAG